MPESTIMSRTCLEGVFTSSSSSVRPSTSVKVMTLSTSSPSGAGGAPS